MIILLFYLLNMLVISEEDKSLITFKKAFCKSLRLSTEIKNKIVKKRVGKKGQISNKLICKLCQHLVYDPRVCKKCGNALYCDYCIHEVAEDEQIKCSCGELLEIMTLSAM